MLGRGHEEEAPGAGIRIDIVRRRPGGLRKLYRNATQGLAIVANIEIVGYTTVAVKTNRLEIRSYSVITINSIQPCRLDED
jgi:hypothetical protein